MRFFQFKKKGFLKDFLNGFLKELFPSFIRGLLLLTPLVLTIYLLSFSIARLDRLIPVRIPGLGMLLILISITLVGYIGSNLLIKSFWGVLERFIEKLPLINMLYSSFKEFTTAFVGNKKKFNKPVLITTNKNPLVQRLGFITSEDLSQIHLEGKVAVYVPQAYAFAGDLYIMEKQLVTPIDASSTEVMKFIVSGGVTNVRHRAAQKDEKETAEKK